MSSIEPAATKTVEVGDKVVFYGVDLEVKSLEVMNGYTLVRCVEENSKVIRDTARAQINALRDEQKTATGAAHAALADQITALDKEASKAIFNCKLRIDLLSWWEERGVWTSPGRLLSDAQRAEAKKVFGSKPKPEGERAVLTTLEDYAKNPPVVKEPPFKTSEEYAAHRAAVIAARDG